VEQRGYVGLIRLAHDRNTSWEQRHRHRMARKLFPPRRRWSILALHFWTHTSTSTTNDSQLPIPDKQTGTRTSARNTQGLIAAHPHRFKQPTTPACRRGAERRVPMSCTNSPETERLPSDSPGNMLRGTKATARSGMNYVDGDAQCRRGSTRDHRTGYLWRPSTIVKSSSKIALRIQHTDIIITQHIFVRSWYRLATLMHFETLWMGHPWSTQSIGKRTTVLSKTPMQ
jgi:hypothetical protein